MRFDEIIGQPRAVAVLRSAIRRGRVAHAYLFHGPEGLGKSSAALAFAQALNCTDEPLAASGDACGQCGSCRLAARGNHPDLRVIGLEVGQDGKLRTEISIHQIRQDPKQPYQTPRPLLQDAYLQPALGRLKVYVVDPADRLSPPAGNALLRLLEEPPPRVVIILIATQASQLLPTLVSRCQQVAFRPAGVDLVEQHLRSLGLPPAEAASLARLSGGRIGWARRAVSRPEVLSARQELLALCRELERRPSAAALRLAEQVRCQALRLVEARQEAAEEAAEEPEAEGVEEADFSRLSLDRALRAELPWCLDVMLSWYRDRLAAARGAPLVNADCRAHLERAALSPEEAEAALEALLSAQRLLQRNANIDLTLESLTTRLLAARP